MIPTLRSFTRNHSQVRQYIYVSRVEVTDYVPNPNAVDELMDRVTPALQRLGDKLSDGVVMTPYQ